jgi:hypothetical protein
LLSVYLENGHKFSLADMMNELKSNNIQPNRVRNVLLGALQDFFLGAGGRVCSGRGVQWVENFSKLKVLL